MRQRSRGDQEKYFWREYIPFGRFVLGLGGLWSWVGASEAIMEAMDKGEGRRENGEWRIDKVVVVDLWNCRKLFGRSGLFPSLGL